MLSHVDVLTVHCPHTPETFHLLSSQRLRLLKKLYSINTSRGEIIDEKALADLLIKKIGGVGLDVFEHEPQIFKNYLKQKMLFCCPI